METVRRNRLVILARNVPADQIRDITTILYESGVRLFEITFNPSLENCAVLGHDAIRTAVQNAPSDMLVGAGTVLTVEQVKAAADAGARFIISPGTDPTVAAQTRQLDMAFIPGAMTPTEILSAWNMGADMVKLFPADDLGYHYIQNIRAPLPHIPLLATGGVNPDTIPEFLSRGITAVGTGVSVLMPKLVSDSNYEEIARLARLHVQIARGD